MRRLTLTHPTPNPNIKPSVRCAHEDLLLLLLLLLTPTPTPTLALSEAGHASLADEVSPQLLPYLLHSNDEAPPQLGGLGGCGGSRDSSSINSHGSDHSRGGSSSDSWVPSIIPSTLARLLCCKSVVYTELES